MVQQLVTGGAGFIGSHIVEALLGRGYQVRVVDSLITGHKENLAGFLSDIEFIEGDLADPEIAARAVQGVECVFHEAAIPSVPRSVRNPLQTQRSGEISTLNLLDAAVRANVRRVIFAASSSAYGNTEVLPKVETMPPRPLSPYAASKVAGEGYMSAFAACHDLDTVSLRYFNVFGPRQDPTSQYSGVIAKFTDIMPRGIRPVIFGDGEQSRDFCFVKNVVHANLLAMECPERLGGEVMNIGCGGRITLNELVVILNRIFGTDHTPVYESTRAGDVRHSLASIAKAKALIGYEPLIQVEEGLRRTINDQQR